MVDTTKRSSTRKGKKGEGMAERALTRIGVLNVQTIATPVKIVGTKMVGRIPYHRVIWGRKVVGDLAGHRSDGVHVLAEVKTTTGGNLTWSLMKKHGEHQAANLDRQSIHAIALVVWVRLPDEVYVMEWPIDGFGYKQSIKPERAAQLNLKTIDVTRWHTNMVMCGCSRCDPNGLIEHDGPWNYVAR